MEFMSPKNMYFSSAVVKSLQPRETILIKHRCILVKAPMFAKCRGIFQTVGAVNVKMQGSVIEEKLSLKMLGQSFSSKLGRGS